MHSTCLLCFGFSLSDAYELKDTKYETIVQKVGGDIIHAAGYLQNWFHALYIKMWMAE